MGPEARAGESRRLDSRRRVLEAAQTRQSRRDRRVEPRRGPTRAGPGSKPKGSRSRSSCDGTFSPTLNAHINKIGKFDIDPDRGNVLRDLIERGEVAPTADFH